jgi:hypothetical protein
MPHFQLVTTDGDALGEWGVENRRFKGRALLMDERSARLAANEAVFRAANEAIDANTRTAGVEGERSYICECGVETCFERVELRGEEYEAVRAHPARFFVVPGHEDLSAGEVVVREVSRFTVVEKQGDGREIVERTATREAGRR